MPPKEEEIFCPPWYPWYVDDVLTAEAVETLTLAEEGAYRRALDKQWKKGSVPADPVTCAAVIGKRCTAKITGKILSLFFKSMHGKPDRAQNMKLEAVRAEQKEKHEKAKARGKKGADGRWHTPPNENGGADSSSMEQAKSSGSYIDKEKEEEIFSNNVEDKKGLGGEILRSVPRAGVKTLPIEQFIATATNGLLRRMNLRSLPSRFWTDTMRWAFANDFTTEDVLECYDLLKQLKWRTGEITPSQISNNLPQIEKLRKDVADQDKPKNYDRSNGNKQKTVAGGHGQRESADDTAKRLGIRGLK